MKLTHHLLILCLIFIACSSNRINDSKVVPVQKNEVIKKASYYLEGYQYKMVIENQHIAKTELPIVVVLHSMGSTPEKYKQRVNNFDIPCRLIYVAAPYRFEDGYTFFQVEPTNYYELSMEEKHKVISTETLKLSQFIKAITLKYKSPLKPVVIGASQGGDLSYMMSVQYPELISGAFPLLAVLDEKIMQSEIKRAKRKPVRIFHGKNDSVVSIDSVRKQVNFLRNNNFDVRLFEYEDCDHQLTKKTKEDYIAEISKIISTN